MSFSRTRLIIIYDLFGWIWLYSFPAAYKFWTHWLCGRAAMWWLLNMALQQCVVLFGSGEPIVHSSRACICVCVREGERGRCGMWLGLEEILVFGMRLPRGRPRDFGIDKRAEREEERHTERERVREWRGWQRVTASASKETIKSVMLCCLMQVSCRFQVDRQWQSHYELWTFCLCDFVCN